jgi:hypothetical protein
LNHTFRSFCTGYFGHRVFICPGWPGPLLGMTGVCHHAQLFSHSDGGLTSQVAKITGMNT